MIQAALAGGRKKTDGFGKVAEQFNTKGVVIQRRKDVDDAAADAKISRFLDHDAAVVAAGHQFGHQAVRFDFLFGDDQFGKAGEHGLGDQPLAKGRGRGHRDLRPMAIDHAIQRPDAVGCGFVVVGHEFERGNIIRREVNDRWPRFSGKKIDFRLPLLGNFG